MIQSELQRQADVIRDQQVAIDGSREALKVCEVDYQEKWLAFQEAEYNLFTTRTLLEARISAQEFNLGRINGFTASIKVREV